MILNQSWNFTYSTWAFNLQKKIKIPFFNLILIHLKIAKELIHSIFIISVGDHCDVAFNNKFS